MFYTSLFQAIFQFSMYFSAQGMSRDAQFCVSKDLDVVTSDTFPGKPTDGLQILKRNFTNIGKQNNSTKINCYI